MTRSSFCVLEKDEKRRIHEAALTVLSDIGLKIKSESALSLLRDAGCSIEPRTRIVGVPEGLVSEALKGCPKEFLLASRDASRDIPIPVETRPAICTDGFAVDIMDDETGELRKSVNEDLARFARLGDALDDLDFFWPTLTPQDVPPNAQLFRGFVTSIENCSKHIQHEALGSRMARLQIAVASEVVGGPRALAKRPIFSAVQCPVAPLHFETDSIEAAMEFAKDQSVILERNPDYFLGPVAYDRLVFIFYGSDQVMAEALKNGDIDVGKFPPLTFDSFKDDPGVFTAAVERYYQSTLGFNCWTEGGTGHPLLRDENLRRALHVAIDKQYIIDNVWRGYADIGYALPAPVVPEFFWQPNQTEALNYSVSRANQMLNESGYDKWDSNGVRLVNRTNPYAALNEPLSFKFNVRNDNPEDMAAAPFVVEMWAKVGVKATIQPIDESALETVVYYSASHDAYIWYWSGDMDPTYILGVMTKDQFKGWNDPFWYNETYDQLYLDQMSQDGAQRVQTVFEMERIWYESSGMIVLSYPYGLYAWTEQHFTGWGDPVALPGRTIDIYFGAPALYMELEPVDGGGGGGISNAVLIGGGVVVAAIVAAVVVMMLMKNRRGGGAAEGAPRKEEKKTGLE